MTKQELESFISIVTKTHSLISNSDIKVKDALESLTWLAGCHKSALDELSRLVEAESKQESPKVVDAEIVLSPSQGQ